MSESEDDVNEAAQVDVAERADHQVDGNGVAAAPVVIAGE